MNLLRSFWNAICEIASTTWDFFESLIDAAFDFVEDLFDTVADFFGDMFAGIWDLIKRGTAKLWELIFPSPGINEPDPIPESVREWIETAIQAKSRSSNRPFSISQGRLLVKTNENNQIQDKDDIKAFFNSKGSPMEGLDAELQNQGGVIEVTL